MPFGTMAKKKNKKKNRKGKQTPKSKGFGKGSGKRKGQHAAASAARLDYNPNARPSIAPNVCDPRHQAPYNSKEDASEDIFLSKAKEILRLPKHGFRNNIMPPAGARPYPYVVVKNCHTLDDCECDKVLGLIPKDQKDLANLLNRRGLPRTVPIADVVNEDGELTARIMRDCIPLDLSRLWMALLALHMHGPGWLKGCKADGFTKFDLLRHIVKDKDIMKGYGLGAANKILRIEPRNQVDVRGLCCTYLNKHGEEKTFQMGMSYIHRVRWDTDFISKLRREGHDDVLAQVDPLIQHCIKIYTKNAVDFLVETNGFPRDMAEALMEKAELHISTNLLHQKSSMGIHTDPFCPVPAGVFGPGVHRLDESGNWVKKCNGGRLFGAKGFFDMSYGPQDGVMFDGNDHHGITYLKALKEEGEKLKGDKWPMERFSMVVFCRFQRSQVRTYLNYCGKWREEWRKCIEDMEDGNAGFSFF